MFDVSFNYVFSIVSNNINYSMKIFFKLNLYVTRTIIHSLLFLLINIQK